MKMESENLIYLKKVTQNIFSNPTFLKMYKKDAYYEEGEASAIIIPDSLDEFVNVVKVCIDKKIKFLVRGSGTNYTGGTIPQDCIVIVTTKLNKIIEINTEMEYAIVEPGVINEQLNNALSKFNYKFTPDPTSFNICTIGGNVSENAGGPNCLFYGVTHDHILGLEIMLLDGTIMKIGSLEGFLPYNNFKSLLVGSEGTLCIILKIWVKIIKKEENIINLRIECKDNTIATTLIDSLFSTGVLPNILEMIAQPAIPDKEIAKHFNSILLLRFAGNNSYVEYCKNKILPLIISRECEYEFFDEDIMYVRAKLIKERKIQLSKLTNIKPKQYLTDCVVPRSKLGDILTFISELSIKYDVVILNTFHAGDGNIHPTILYEDNEKERRILSKVKEEILEKCLALSGSISAEHGIGIEKKDYLSKMFNNHEIELMELVKSTLDPYNILNPDKIFKWGDFN